MPTYEYSCPQCGKFEVFQKITDNALKTCPTCGQTVARVINGGMGVIFKGSGFYTTDYGSKKNMGAAKTETEPQAKSETKSESIGTDSKAS